MSEISIVIRTFNEEKHIGNLLRAIEEQEHHLYEIILVDSGSTDRTLEIAQQFNVKIIHIESRDFTFGYSLNVGCKASKGKYLVFPSAHVLPVDEHWLKNLTTAFKNEKIGMVYGRQVGAPESKFSEKMDFLRLFSAAPVNKNVFIDYANNANSAIRRDIWLARPFDEYLFGLEDIEWAKYITSNGYQVHYEPNAAIYHIHEESWPQVFNRYRREAIAAFRMQLPHPPQARTGILWFINNIITDLLCSFPNYRYSRFKEIIRFRYFQWSGTRQGWFRDRALDFDREKYSLFYPETNKALIVKEKGEASVEEFAIPQMKPGDILIQVEFVEVTVKDIEMAHSEAATKCAHERSGAFIPGSIFSGTIVKIGASTKNREQFSVGQKVIGVHKQAPNYFGAYAQLVVVPGNALHVLPESINMQTALLAEPLALIEQVLRKIQTNAKLGESIAILGAGVVGNLCTQVLVREGYSVRVFDSNPHELGYLKDYIPEGVSTNLNIERFNYIIETTGNASFLDSALNKSRKKATIILLESRNQEFTYDLRDVVNNGKAIFGISTAEEKDYEKAIRRLVDLKTQIPPLKVFPLEEYGKAWELKSSSKGARVLIKP